MKKRLFDLEELEEAMEENGGFCIACGAYTTGVEPDARSYLCEECDEHAVYGAEELLVMGYVK